MTDLPAPPDLLECAIAAAQRAGEHARQNAARRTDAVQVLTHDVKLKLDSECQTMAEETVLTRFPNHCILGEEGMRQGSEPVDPADTLEWIIDPIDGTVNFSHGLPLWCCSVAVRQGARVLAGAVYIPERSELFTATADGPAMLNGDPIAVSATDSLSKSMIMTGMDKDLAPGVAPFAVFSRIALASQKARICGSAAMDICSVACGRADGYFEGGIYIWDIAAAALIVERAGGNVETFSTHDEPHRLRFLATNGRIHDELKTTIRSALSVGS